MDELIYSSAKSIAQAIRDKKVSASEALEAHLKRIAEVNPALNAVVQLAADRARAEAKQADDALARGDDLGALHGVPFTLKDSIDTEGIITTGGTMGRKNFVPDEDATVAARLRAAVGVQSEESAGDAQCQRQPAASLGEIAKLGIAHPLRRQDRGQQLSRLVLAQGVEVDRCHPVQRDRLA